LRQLKEQIPVTGYSSDRLGESCDWVSTTDQFKTWRIDQSHPILVIVGHPGSGRSKVAEFVIDTLKENTKSQDRNADRSRITLSHFCRWTVPAEEQSNIWLYDILLQLLEAYPAMFKEIYRKLDSPPATYSDLEALLLRLLQASYLREVDIVVDGLDECGPESLRLMYKTIGQLGRLEEGPRIRHLLTTTSTTHILEPLQKKIISLALDSFPEHRNKQIMAFIENRLENSPNKHRYSDDFSILIRQELFKKASFQFHVSKKAESNLANDNDDSCSLYETRESEGNFNWILAAFDVVEGEKSIGAMRRRLATLPTHLKGLYDIFFERVPEAHKEFVAQVLHFTRCSFRPLESTTLTFALAIKDIHKTTSQVWEEQVIDLAGTIAPFTGDMVVFHNGCVAFTHRSLSTYLDSTAYVGDDSMNDKDGTTKNSFPRLNTRRTHCEMAAACLRCLMLDDSLDIDVDSSQTSKLPFINYAEAYWFKHAKNATGLHGELKSLIETFMNSPRMSKWLERRRKAQTEILLPEAEFQYHVLASLDLLGLTAIDETIKPLVNAKDSCGRTPLHYAIANNASKSIKWLLEEGANINVVDNDGFSCLHFAVSSGDLQLVRQFGNTDAVHPSLLNLAIERRNWNVVELLLDKIPHIPQPANDSWTEWKGKSGRGIIHQAVLSRNISIVESFLGKGANLSLIDDDGRTALHLAANIAERSIAEALLERAFALSLDSLLDTEDAEGNTALHLATESGDVEVISLLADQGADLSHLNKAGQLPLHIAAMYGYEKVVSFLLKIGSPIKTDNNQPSPLHLASAWGWSTVAKRLVRAGAAIEGRDNKGRTPIYLAASNGSKVMAELLLSFGAKAAVCDNDGITPLHIAALKGWEPVVALLLDAGADVNAKEKKHGQTILHFAAISKNPSDTLVQCLLDAKADITQKCDNGNTPLAAAQESGNTLIAELLSKAENGQPYAWNISSPKARLSRPQSTDSFGAATRLEILWEAEKREERQRVEVFDRL
jgi:ankyrin repeat protein